MEDTLQPKTPTLTANVVDKMKKKKKRNRLIWISLGALLILVIVVVVVAGGKEKGITVQTEKVSQRTITEIVQATGKIQPETSVKISPEVSGEITELPFKEGAQVKKGQMLVKIKPTTIQAQYEAGAAQLESAKSRVQQNKAQRITTELALKRMKALHGKNLVSDADIEQSQSQFDIAEANYSAAQHDVDATASQLKQFAESLRKTAVPSPMDGVITQLISQLGEKVVGTSQFTGTEMMSVSDLSVMNAMVEVDENDVVNLKLGDTTRVSIDAFPNRTFIGTVVEIANSAKLKGVGTQDQSTNFEVKIRLVGFESGELRPGMSCTAKIETQTKSNVMTVPIMAVTRRTTNVMIKDPEAGAAEVGKTKKPSASDEEGQSPLIVFVIDGKKVKVVKVKTGVSDNSYVEITEGLKGGEEIVKGNYSAVSKDLEEGKMIKIDNNAGFGATKDTKK